MYKYSICACVRITNPFLFVEWLSYQFLIGFEHIYLYDNKSNYLINDLCRRYKNKVTIYHTDEEHIQLPSYNHFLQHHRTETEYISFLDDDEFIIFNDFETIDNVMKYMEYPDYIVLNWKMMGCQQRVRSISEYLIESNTKSEKEFHNHVKGIVKTENISHIDNPHCIGVYTNKTIFKDGSNDILLYRGYIPGTHTLHKKPLIWINHYYKISRNDFLLKCERGQVNNVPKRNFNEEFTYDKDENLIETNDMKRMVEKIKEIAKTPIDLIQYSMTN
jgi:hypothetical protein